MLVFSLKVSRVHVKGTMSSPISVTGFLYSIAMLPLNSHQQGCAGMQRKKKTIVPVPTVVTEHKDLELEFCKWQLPVIEDMLQCH